MSAYGTVYAKADWPHGLRCGDCDKLLTEGDRYGSNLQSFVDDVPVVLIVCLECALRPSTGRSRHPRAPA